MPRNGGKWIVWLRSHRQPLPADLSALFNDPVPLVRVNAAGAWWGRTGEAKRARDVVGEAIRTGDRDAVIFGCQLLAEMGPTAGDVVALLWPYLGHDDRYVRLNAAGALCDCCTDRRVLIEARSRLITDTGDRLVDACMRYIAARMQKRIEGDTAAAPAPPPKV
jgi:hypothetical protein